MYSHASSVLLMTAWFLSGVIAVPLHRLGKRRDFDYDGDVDEDDEEEQEESNDTQTTALVSVFTVVGLICLVVVSMMGFHYWRKRGQLKDETLKEEVKVQQEAEKNLDDQDEPRCAWCYIAENKLCTWCAGEKSDPGNESIGTTIYSNRVSEETQMSPTSQQLSAKASFRPDVGVYTIASPAASFKGKGRAVDDSRAPSPAIEPISKIRSW